MLAQNRISRITPLVSKVEPLDTELEELPSEPKRRRFFVRIAVQTHNVHLAALVYTVAYCTVRKHNRRGLVFTAEKVGYQIGLKIRQTQKLFRRAIKEKWIQAHLVPHGWFASVKPEWHRELYLDSAWDHFDVAEAARLRSVSAAIVMDYIDPAPKGEPFEEPEPIPGWQHRLSAEGVVRLLPWLSYSQAWRILESLTDPVTGCLTRKRVDGVYEYQLVKSRHLAAQNTPVCISADHFASVPTTIALVPTTLHQCRPNIRSTCTVADAPSKPSAKT